MRRLVVACRVPRKSCPAVSRREGARGTAGKEHGPTDGEHGCNAPANADTEKHATWVNPAQDEARGRRGGIPQQLDGEGLHPSAQKGHPTDAQSVHNRGLPTPRTPPDASSRQLGLPHVVRGTLTTHHAMEVGQLVPQRARAARCLPLKVRATKFANDPRSSIPEGPNVPTQPTLLLRLAARKERAA